MISRKASRRYARALMALSLDQNCLDAVETTLRQTARALKRSPGIFRFIASSVIPGRDKTALLDKLFSDSVPPLLLRFLKVLVEKKRFHEIGQIEEEFRWLYEERHGIREVDVIAASPLAAENEARLREILKNRLHKEVFLKFSVNRRLLGGLVLRFGGREIDASYRSRLEAVRQILMK